MCPASYTDLQTEKAFGFEWFKFKATTIKQKLGTVAESVERRPRVREIVNSVPGRDKPLTYKIATCHFLARCSALYRIGQGVDRSVSG